MIPFSLPRQIHLCCTPIDMRKNFDGLSGLVTTVLKKNPLQDGVFVFVNKPRTKMKLFFWDRHGYWILYKRLEMGTFQMPPVDCVADNSPETISIAYEQLLCIIEGIDLTSVKRNKRYKLL
jgi:transposase